MRKLQLTSRRVLATLMAVVLLAVLIPTVLTDKAMAADYVERDGEYYFWTEGGLRQLIADCPWGGIVHLVRDREGWRYDGTELIFTEDLTIPEEFHVKMGSADVSVAEGKTLTVAGTLELDAGNSVRGPGSLVYDNGTYIKTRDAGTLEEMNTALADAASAAESDGASGSVSITNNITADGDYTLTAGAMLQVETGYVLTVGGTLTVPAGAVLVNNGGVVCEAMVIADGGVVRNNSDAEIVKRDEANVGLYYGDKLTINGALYNKGTIGCGYRSSTMIEVGATAVLENDNVLGGGLTMDWSVDPAATIRNSSEIDITFDNRGHMTAGENIQYKAGDYGMVLCAQPVTDAGGTAALQAAAAKLAAAEKADYEQFCLLVRNDVVGTGMDFTMDADLTLSRDGVDALFIKQYGYAATAGVFTLASGRTITVQPGGQAVTIGATLKLAGTLALEAGTETQEEGFGVFNGAVQMQPGGLLQNNGYVAMNRGIDVGSGRLHNMASGNMIIRSVLTMNHGSTLVNEGWVYIDGTACLDGTVDLSSSKDFQITGKLERGSALTLTGEEKLGYLMAVDTAAQAAEAFAQQDEVLLRMQGDMLLTEALCVPAGKALYIGERYSNDSDTLTVTDTTLTVEGNARVFCYAGLKLIGSAMTIGPNADVTIEQPMTIGSGSTVTNDGSLTASGGLTLDGTLTVRSWTHIRGDLRASGTLDLAAENADLRIVGQLIRGEGFTLLGSESSITYMSQVRNVEELGAALDSGARQVELLLTEDTVLNEAVTVPSGVTLQILQDSENVPTFTIGENGSLTVEPSQQGENYYRQTDVTAWVPVVVKGTLTLRESSSANMEAGLTVTATGKVNNNGEISVDDGHPLEVADSWDDHWTNGKDGVLLLKKELQVQDADAIVSAVAAEINSLTVDERFSWMNLNVYVIEGSGTFSLAEAMTIPAWLHLNFYDNAAVTEVRIEDDGTLTVDGAMYSNAPVVVNGAMTVNGGANINNNVQIGGTLTVSESGQMWCSFITDKGEGWEDGLHHGVIVNNGRLYAEGSEFAYNDDPLTPSGDVKNVSTEEELRAALEKYDSIIFQGDELTLTGDLTVPNGKWVRINAGTFTVPAGVTLTLESGINVYGTMQLNGTVVLEQSGGLYVEGRLIRGAQSSVVENGGWMHYQRVIEDINQLEEAFAEEGTENVTLRLSEDYVLTRTVTVPAGKMLHITAADEQSVSFTIDVDGKLVAAAYEENSGSGRLQSEVPVTVKGTLSVGQSAAAVFDSDLTVDTFGYVVNDGNISVGGTLTVADPWRSHMKQGETGCLTRSIAVQLTDSSDDGAVLEDALQQQDDRFDRCEVNVRIWPERTVVIDRDITVPSGTELQFQSGNIQGVRIASAASVTVDGTLAMSTSLAVDGALTVNANGEARISEDVRVGGTLTVNENGFLWCRFLSDTAADGKTHGTIVNNGRMSADGSDIRYNDDPLTPSDGRTIVRTEEALRAALEESRNIVYRGSDLTLTADLVIPENIRLRIEADTLTVPEGMTLTNRGQLDIEADLALYGTLRAEGGYLDGVGAVIAGDQNHVEGHYFRWTSVLYKDGGTAELTMAEMQAALSNTLVSKLRVSIGGDTQLSLKLSSSDVLPDTWNIDFWGKDGSTLIVPEAAAVQYNGWNLTFYTPVVINGTMTLENGLRSYDSITVNGTLTTYGAVDMYQNDMVMGADGKLYLRERTNSTAHGRVVFYCTDAEHGLVLPEGAAMADHVLRDSNACRLEKSYVTRISGLSRYIEMAQNDSTMHYAVDLNGEWDEDTGRSLPVQFTGELTIPANMTLECHSGGGMEVLGTMCVYGEMVCNADIQVSGGLVMCLGSTAELRGDVTVTGALTVQQSAVATIYYLSGSGTITNNGTLKVSTLEAGTVISGSGDGQVNSRRADVSSPEALLALLEKLDAASDAYQIRLVRENDSSDTVFTISSDMTIPSNVDLYTDGTDNGFTAIEVGPSVTLNVAGRLNAYSTDLRIGGTLNVLEGALIHDPQDGTTYRGRDGHVEVNALAVNGTGKVVNRGGIYTSAKERDLAVNGALENYGYISCTALYHTGEQALVNNGTIQINNTAALNAVAAGTVTNAGNMTVSGQLELLNGTMDNRAYLECGSALVNGVLTNVGDMSVNSLLSAPNGSVDSSSGKLTYGSCDTPDNVQTDWRIASSVEELRTALEKAAAGDTLTLVLSADTELTEDLTVPAGVELVVRNPYTSSGATSPKTGAVLYAASAGGASSGSASSGGISAGTSSTVELAVASGVTLTANYDLRLEDVSMTVHGQVTTRGNTHNAGALRVESDGVWENHGNIYCYGGLDLYGKLQNYGMVLAMREETSGGLILRDGWISLQNGSQWDLNSGSIGCMSALNGAISGYGDGYEMSEADSNDFCWLRAQTVTQPDGDVNGDGTVDTADLDALVRHVACIEELGDLSRADIDGDGDIDADDITVLAQMLQQMGVVD